MDQSEAVASRLFLVVQRSESDSRVSSSPRTWSQAEFFGFFRRTQEHSGSAVNDAAGISGVVYMIDLLDLLIN